MGRKEIWNSLEERVPYIVFQFRRGSVSSEKPKPLTEVCLGFTDVYAVRVAMSDASWLACLQGVLDGTTGVA